MGASSPRTTTSPLPGPTTPASSLASTRRARYWYWTRNRPAAAAACPHRSRRRHCERSEAIHRWARQDLDCFVASLLAMTERLECLTRISHSVEAHRGANQRKLLCSNDFCLIQGAPRCRQSVAQNDLILEWWKAGLWKRPLMAGW